MSEEALASMPFKPKSKVEFLKHVARRFHDCILAKGGYEVVAGHLMSFREDDDPAFEEDRASLECEILEAIGESQLPAGWKPWDFSKTNLDDQPVMQVKRVTVAKIKEEGLESDEPKPKKAKKEPKPKKEKEARDLRTVFMKRLAELDPEKLRKPWMATKSLRCIKTIDELIQWRDRILNDKSLWRATFNGDVLPAVAVDTETFGTISETGLDTRVVQGRPQIDIAGICLCADGFEALYVPINHEVGPNLDRATVRGILQPFFDQAYLVFFNAKFDREVLRLTMGLTFRDFPYYEDVQVDNYLLDPKADLDEEVADMGGNGLKDLSLKHLGIEQIELHELSVVKAAYNNVQTGKTTYRDLMAPFSWIPPEIAYLYAAPDALTTWLLWEKMCHRAWTMKFVFKLDHQLIDTLTWIERQRFLIDVERLKETIDLHHRKMVQFRKRLADLSGNPDFNPGSPKQLQDVLFNKLGFKKTKISDKGAASTDKSVIEDLKKQKPGDPFLAALSRYRSYASLHPDSLEFDPRDHSARMFFKQCTVAGGRLAAMGGGKKKGKGKDDGGFGLNPQAIKGVKGNKWASGRQIMVPQGLEDFFDPLEWVDPISNDQLHESILKKNSEGAVTVEAPDVYNGVANYMGKWWSFRPENTVKVRLSQEAQDLGFPSVMEWPVSDLRQNVDANEVVNLRGLFIAPPGYTLFVTDYSNIEMRVAANVSREPSFIHEFMEGSGDFHTLTASQVFPEFNDPKTDKVTRKMLRDLAKIINFALLYGGTEHTIYENMKKQDPTITKEKAKAMVDKYWEAVPKFADWVYGQRSHARKTLTCKTPDGRVIDFRPVLIAEGVDPDNVPTVSYSVKQSYWNLKRRSEELAKAGRKEEADRAAAAAKEMWEDPASGLKLSSIYNKFVGKFERVSINAPLQGLAGDFMRRALTLLHRWAVASGIEGALLVHASVHDEIDFCIKNEYVPYVLPRITRLMKLRDMHKLAKWPVPIECDCEYGTSWDVKEHLTGDDGHVAAAYTKIPGLEDYVPPVFDNAVVEQLLEAAASGDEETVQAIAQFLTDTLHPRVKEVVARMAKAWTNPTECRRLCIASLQLTEYWAIDQSDESEGDELLTQYMDRQGLDPFPGLGDPVIYSINVEELEPYYAPIDDAAPASFDDIAEPEDFTEDYRPEEPEAEPVQVTQPTVTIEVPVSRVEEVLAPRRPQVPLMQGGVHVMRQLTDDEARGFSAKLGVGAHSFQFIYRGDLIQVKGVSLATIPEEYMEMVDVE